jgi:phosphoribosyl-ATP pyrophosphohydrolase/phosphoribosyl-AMP cyclohydrolase
MTIIFQDSLSADILGISHTDSKPTDLEIGNSIDLKDYIGSSGSEEVEIVNITKPREGFEPNCIIVMVKPSSYKGIDPENSMFESTKGKGFLYKLEDIVEDRQANPSEASFTSSLLYKGMNVIGTTLINQAAETVLEAKDGKKQSLSDRAADLLYHFVILLSFNKVKIADIEEILHKRHKKLHGKK